MARNPEWRLADCKACMQSTPRLQRQALGCGFEPRPRSELVPITPWQPPPGKVGYHGPRPTVCAGFSTKLPEVAEVALARRHWKQNSLPLFLEGEQAHEVLLEAVIVLDNEFSSVERYIMTPSKDGGGAG
jgi:hypothetical protein